MIAVAGLMLIMIGFLVGRYPILLAGMHRHRDNESFKKRMGRLFRSVLVVTGALVCLEALILHRAVGERVLHAVVMGTILTGVAFGLYLANRQDADTLL